MSLSLYSCIILFSCRFGFKIWGLCSSSGFVVQVEPYCGSSTNIPKHFANMGPDVVVGLVTQAGVVSGSEVYFDNLFTSIPLMVWLSAKGILWMTRVFLFLKDLSQNGHGICNILFSM